VQQVQPGLMVHKDHKDRLVVMVLLALKVHKGLQDRQVQQDHKVQLQQLLVLAQQQH
jgi:hypothetical protein